MDAEAVERSEAPAGRPGAGPRGGTVLLAAVALTVALGGGWWWRITAPVASPAGAVISAAVPGPDGTFTIDPGTGTAQRSGPGPATDILPGHAGGGSGSSPVTIWTERSRLTPGQAVLRQAWATDGTRHHLHFSCSGPGELLVVVDGARAADPFTAGCNGSITSTEVTGAGGPFQISLSTAGGEPLDVEARLVALD